MPLLGVGRVATDRESSTALIIGGVAFCCLLKVFGPACVALIFNYAKLGRIRDLILLSCALAASVMLHELGHLTAAFLLDFDVLGGALGPFRVSRLDGRWSMQFSGRSWFAASLSAIPKPKSPWRRNMLLVVAAGPLATLACCAAAISLLSSFAPVSAAGCFLAFCAELNAVLFVLGLFPNGRHARVRNDANLFLALLLDPSDSQNILLYHLLMQIRRQGFRPCFYPQDVIRELPHAQTTTEMTMIFAQTISDWAFDRGDLLSADAWDRRAVENGAMCDGRFYSHALAHSACLDLLLRNDHTAARSKCSDIDYETLQPEWLRHRARAVQELLRGDILEGMGELQRADYCLPRGLPYFDFERELVQSLRQKAKVLSALEIPLRKETSVHD
jgi:Zn-dependent protease